VQTNFGGVLTIASAPVGQELGQYYLRQEIQQAGSGKDKADGSCMIVVATDAPHGRAQLEAARGEGVARRSRTGSSASNGSGDYAIAFSTPPQVRIHANDKALTRNAEGDDQRRDVAAVSGRNRSTEEAVYNSMFQGDDDDRQRTYVEALPIEKTVQILKEHRVINKRPPKPGDSNAAAS